MNQSCKYRWYVRLIVIVQMAVVIPVSADPPLLHRLNFDKVDEYFLRGHYLLDVHGGNMEKAFAQLINFLEGEGYGAAERTEYSGIPIIYEYAPLTQNLAPYRAKFRSANLAKMMDFLCKHTQGLFRENLFNDRVLVIRRQRKSVLFDVKIGSIKSCTLSIADAVNLVLAKANRSDPAVRIRFHRPHSIVIRGMKGSPEHLIHRQLSGDILDRRIKLNVNGNSLVHGLVAILIAQPIPFYLTLKPEPDGGRYTHTLRFDTLPNTTLPGLENVYGYRLR